jgi:outer membrane protein
MKKIMITLVIVLLVTVLFAGEQLTLENALQLAKSNNPDLKAAANNLKAAEKSMQSSYLSLGPSASLSYNKRYMNPGIENNMGTNDESSQVGISASQPLFNGGKVYLGTQMSKNAYKMQQESYSGKLLEIRAVTEQKYYTLQGNRELVKALEKSLEQHIANLEIAQAKLDAGIFSQAEYLQMRSEKLSSELDLINMQNAYELSKLDLANYLGYKSDFEVEEFDMASYQSILQVLREINASGQKNLEKQLLLLGEKQNTTLNISRIGIDNAHKAKTMAAGNLLPSLNLSYSYDWANSNLEEDFEGSSTLAVVASLPIFPIADNVLDYQSARYDLKSTENTHECTQNSIILAIRSSVLNLFTSARKVESAEVSNELAWETWHQMRERFEQGLLSASDLLSAEVMVLNSDYNYIAAQQGFLESMSSLVQLLSLEDKEQLINIIEEVGK